MTLRALGKRIGVVVLAVGAAALLLGAVLGQPVLVSFVETGSMQPTLDPGDGFVAVPTALAGPVGPGDVVVFRAERLHGGGLVTHRVVGDTPQGYVTQGDANTFTDQSGSEPPVKESQIVAVALSVGGHIVVVPELGTVLQGIQSGLTLVQYHAFSAVGLGGVQGTQGLAVSIFVLTIAWYVVSVWRDRGPDRDETDDSGVSYVSGRAIVVGLTVLVVVGATATMVVPGGPTKYEVVSAEFDSEGPRVIPTGETETTTHTVGNGGVVPIYVFLEPDGEGISVDRSRMRVPARSATNATVALSAPPQTGYYRFFVTEYRYLAVLPQPVVATLYHQHPWLPIVVIDGLIAVPYYLVGAALVGSESVRMSSLSRDKPLGTRIRRAIRRLYS